MNTTRTPAHPLTAGDLMNRDLVVIPRQMLVREAARLLHRAQVSAAPVVDEHGRCVGLLSPADVFRWVEAGCPEAVVDPVLTCPYQVQGRLLNGNMAVICLRSDGNCPFQMVQPTTGGRHTMVCMRQETEHSPFGAVPRYMTSDVISVRPQATLRELARRLIDARAAHLVVLDEIDRPVGIVPAADVLKAVADDRDRGSADPENTDH
jgi:CBS domain-containing protein